MARLSGQRPSRLLALRRAGASRGLCLAFDEAVLEFGERFDAERQATKEMPARRNRRRQPTETAPKWTEEDLRRFLGLAEIERWEDDEDVKRLAAEILSGKADWLMPGEVG